MTGDECIEIRVRHSRKRLLPALGTGGVEERNGEGDQVAGDERLRFPIDDPAVAVAHRPRFDVEIESAAGEAPGTARRHRFVRGELPAELQQSELRLEPGFQLRFVGERGNELLELIPVRGVETASAPSSAG